ncbi:MAG: DUF2782 domain-containing protein [Proteobacteria bacterium]|jgi:hypothetical protein|nr:DUF2782 domain-containing protein [Pseudomonadota bacterium]
MRRSPARLLARLAPLALALPLAALAQAGADLQPLPAVPPPPPDMAPFDAALEPQVTIKKRDGDTVEEFRIQGRLYMIKVTPPHGVPYYLVDNQGDGNFMRMETMDTRTRVPMWIIKSF